KMIVPSPFQLPPAGLGASASVWTELPSADTRFSLPSAKKPSERASGDQNGRDAPAVRGTGRGETDPSSRIQTLVRSSGARATNASWRPSGERANSAPLTGKLVCSGAQILKLIG